MKTSVYQGHKVYTNVGSNRSLIKKTNWDAMSNVNIKGMQSFAKELIDNGFVCSHGSQVMNSALMGFFLLLVE